MQQPPNAGQSPDRKSSRPGRRGAGDAPRRILLWSACCILALLPACSGNDELIKTTAGYPPVELKPSDLPTFAVGDSFTFDNPVETWTVTTVDGGLITWRSTLGGSRKTMFEPFMPPVEWTAADRSAGGAVLTGWGSGLFPLKGGLKAEFRTRAHRNGESAATPYEWKCYSGNPRKVSVAAGAYPAYPVFCRRSDGLTVQSFYAPEVNVSLMTTRRQRPAAAEKRELVSFKLANGPRIAAATVHGLPAGVALAAVEPSVRPPQPAVTAVADARGAGTPAMPPAAQPQIAQAPAAPAPAATAAPLPAVPPAAAPPAVAAQQKSPPPAQPAATRKPAPPPSIAAAPAKPRPAPPPSIARAAPPPAAAAPSRAAAPKTAGSPTIAAPPLMAPSAPAPALALARPAPPAEPRAARGPAVGGFGAQIASYQDADNVERGWTALRKRHTPLLNGVGHVVRRVDLNGGKGVFHRLIAGPFPARSGAEQLCRSIRARGAACLVQPIEG